MVRDQEYRTSTIEYTCVLILLIYTTGLVYFTDKGLKAGPESSIACPCYSRRRWWSWELNLEGWFLMSILGARDIDEMVSARVVCTRPRV